MHQLLLMLTACAFANLLAAYWPPSKRGAWISFALIALLLCLFDLGVF